MVSRSVSRLMIVGGMVGVGGAMLWWRDFYAEVGRFLGFTELPIECLYKLGGACGLISDAASVVTSNAYNPFLFWVASAVLLVGIILEGFPSGERDDVYLTRERDRDHRSPDLEDRRDPYL